ncbi:MAG: carbohydrate ABC transporter permease [Chloroflexi bacterium]|nr:carbohydrate ABC transporter permease [Chloroflexota bacterium]
MSALALRMNRFLKERRLKWYDIPLWAFGMFIALIWFAPFLWMVITSFKPLSEIMTTDVEWVPRNFIIQNYVTVFEQPVIRWMINSFIVAVGTTAVAVLLGALAGYALARLHFPGRGVVFGLLLASIMIPGEMAIVPLYIAFLKARLTDSYLAIGLPFIANVFSVYIFRQFFLTLPKELEEAASIDGASRFGIFIRVALPLARSPPWPPPSSCSPPIGMPSSGRFSIIFDENMKTMPVGMIAFAPVVGSQVQLVGFGPAMAGVTLLTLPSLLVFLLLQRYFIEGVSRTGLKG